MIAVTRPMRCIRCGKDMTNYKIEKDPNFYVFRCSCGSVMRLSEDEYKTILLNGSVTRKVNFEQA